MRDEGFEQLCALHFATAVALRASMSVLSLERESQVVTLTKTSSPFASAPKLTRWRFPIFFPLSS